MGIGEVYRKRNRVKTFKTEGDIQFTSEKQEIKQNQAFPPYPMDRFP